MSDGCQTGLGRIDACPVASFSATGANNTNLKNLTFFSEFYSISKSRKKHGANNEANDKNGLLPRAQGSVSYTEKVRRNAGNEPCKQGHSVSDPSQVS